MSAAAARLGTRALPVLPRCPVRATLIGMIAAGYQSQPRSAAGQDTAIAAKRGPFMAKHYVRWEHAYSLLAGNGGGGEVVCATPVSGASKIGRRRAKRWISVPRCERPLRTT